MGDCPPHKILVWPVLALQAVGPVLLRAAHKVGPTLRPRNGPRIETRSEATVINTRTAIRPLVRTIDESCSDWIGLDISADVQELDVSGDSHGAISLLVDVSFANRPIPPVKSTNVRTGQPVHVGRKCAALVGAQYQVEVIRHRAVDEQRYVESLPSIPEQSEKLPVIMGIPEDTFPPVSAVDDMLNAAGNNLSADSRHRVVTSFLRGAQRGCRPSTRC